MPFPFRNPVNSAYDSEDDPGGTQQVDPHLEGIVQKMIDAGEPEENIASVIKQYKSDTAKVPPRNPQLTTPTKPTSGTGLGSGPTPNPDDEFTHGVIKSLFSGEAPLAGLKGGLGWLKGAVLDLPESLAGGLETVGGMLSHPITETEDVMKGIKAIPGQVANTFEHAGSDPYAFGETMGQLGGQPLMADIAPGMIKAGAPVAAKAAAATLPVAGRGLQNVGEFVAKNQPITGMAPPFATPRTLRLIEKGVGRGTNAIGHGLEKIGDRLTNKLAETRPDSDVVSSTLKNVKKPTPPNANNEGQTSPNDVTKLQAKATSIQDNIDKKYGSGNTDKASPATQDTLNKTRQAIPVLNRPGTIITVKNATPEQIQQAQRLGYQIESRDSLGNVRFKQTGRPMTITSQPSNTSLSNIDLNTPINIGGGQF